MKVSPEELNVIYTEALTDIIPDIKWQRNKYGWSERQTRGYAVHVITKRYSDCLPWIGRHHLVDYVMERV